MAVSAVSSNVSSQQTVAPVGSHSKTDAFLHAAKTCSMTLLATAPLAVVGVAMLIESIVRFPISLVGQYGFGWKEDGVSSALFRLKTAILTTIPILNVVNYNMALQLEPKGEGGCLSKHFYTMIPVELALGVRSSHCKSK